MSSTFRIPAAALEDPVRRQVLPGTGHGSRVEVRRVHLEAGHRRPQGRAHGTRAAAEIDHDRAGRQPGQGAGDQQLRASARHEHPAGDRHPQPAEVGPAHHHLERGAGDALGDQSLELGRGAGLGDEQGCLLLGEDTARGAQPRDDLRQGHAGSDRCWTMMVACPLPWTS